MRVHTALHLLSVVIPLPVTGGSVSADKGRLDFDMPEAPDDRDDLAAEFGHQDWPRFNPEQILAMSPSLIVTQLGMAEVICQHSALRNLPACGTGGHVLELSGRYHADPGLGVVEASWQVQTLLAQLP